MRVAPADAEGTILYSAGNKDSMILGLTVESSAPAPVLRPEQVALGTITSDGRREAPVTCIGCHEASPDGRFLGFTAQAPWGNAIAALAAEGARAGEVPAFLGAGARRALAQQDMGIQSFSAARWRDREHVAATALGVSTSSQLAWLDLDAPLHDGRTPLRIVRRRGDPRGAGAPALSADGETIAYVSTNVEYTGRLGAGEADLYAVPSRGGAGGEARPIAGASEPDHAEYYPAFSPDDRYLIYTRAPNGNMYQRPAAEIYAIPSTGGTPVRLAANDPPACSGRPSPGVTNSWARWSPVVGRVGQSTYYWLVFSSRRRGDTPQIYVAGVVEEGGRLSTFGALHVPIQNPDGNNHTPTWSRYRLPE
ncbi:MAG: PD40 domain-containing protein [Polyangiaceae bacterium]|nr:PD40 domain-containing protein [Polyangiaceae bacterium]